jgi:tRNA threonylcarbamoyladenosine biosynthesis protein TsaE
MEKFVVQTISDLPQVVNKLLPIITKGKTIAFYGKMGAGKTTLIKTICEAMGVENIVTSPTFALVNEYHTNTNEIIYHFDFYRINKVEELFDLGYEDYFYSGHYCFMEWPELASNILPPDTIKIEIEEQPDNSRIISINQN